MNEDRSAISVAICNRLNINLKGKTTGSVMVSCWEHQDKHPSMSINLTKNLYHCFSCGIGGKLTDKYYQTFHKSIYKDLGINTQNNLLRVSSEVKAVDFNELPHSDIMLEAKKLYPISITEAGKIWLKQRGFVERDLQNVHASYCQWGACKKRSDPTDKSQWIYIINRVVIPIYEKGFLISYELRDIMGSTHYEKQLAKKNLSIDDHPYKKTIYPKNSSINTLYDLDNLKTDEPLYIVEGLMDLISLRTNSFFKNSTCLFHCQPTERQYYLLNKFSKIIYIVDNDGPGLMGAKKLMERNSNASYLCPPDTMKDINECLQNKDPRYKSIQDLLDKDWISKTKSSIKDLDFKLKPYFKE